MKDTINTSGYYRIKVIPNQNITEYRGMMADNTLKIAVKAAPEKGKANRELIRYLSKNLDIPQKNIVIANGLSSRIKVVHIAL